MRRLFPIFLTSVLFFLAGVVAEAQTEGGAQENMAASVGGEAWEIDGVIIDGNQRIDTEAIRVQLEITSGLISREQVTEEVKNLYRTGFFDQVRASLIAEQKPVERTLMKYAVVEKPIVRKVFIKGNEEIEEDDLAEIFTFGTRRFLDKAKLKALTETARMFYQQKGFYDATFDYSVVPVGENQVDLTFTVEEGERYSIRRISFRGAEDIDPDDLRDVIQTQEYKWWSSWIFGTGRLNREMLENDKVLIRQYFLDHGYVDGSVGDPVIERRDGGIYISFDIDEGERYQIGEVLVAGDLIDDDERKTLEGIEIDTGDTFSATTLREDSFTISDKFADNGYAFANVIPQTSINRDLSLVNIRFEVDKGKLVTVNRIDIRGNDKTYDNVIRRELRIGEKETFSRKKVERSRRLLERTGYFDEVDISTQPTERDDEVDLLVNVREGSTGAFSAGAGYSSADGAIFNARLSENNIFGTGKRVEINVDVGDERDNIILSYFDRRFRDSFYSLGVNALRAERVFTDFDRSLTGGGFTVGYPLEEAFGEWSQDIQFNVRYQYLDIEIKDVEDDAAFLVQESEGNSSSSALTPSLLRNTINNPLNPTEGSRQEISFEFAGLGGNEEYWIFEALNTLYYPLLDTSFGEFVFSWRTRFGYGESYNDEPLPLFRRYFPGGINSVRGFEVRTLGPKDDNGNEFGGSKQLVNNVELIFPLIGSAGLKGVVFFDVGEAFDDEESIDFGELRQAYGYGLRWMSPLGPIRIEFGFPLDKEDGEDSMVTLFSFGAPL